MSGFALTAVIAIVSSWLIMKRYYDSRSFSENVLVWFILLFAQIVLIELILGICGMLYFYNVLLMQLLILVLAVLACRNEKVTFLSKPDMDFIADSKLLLFAISIFLGFFVIKGYFNLINPPLSPDSLAQHLAFPAAWVKNGNLDTSYQIFGSCPILHPGGLETSSGSYYPINAQLFFTWLMLSLKNAFLADLGEAPFYIVGIICVYTILIKYNVSRKAALLCGLTWVLIPNIFKQLRTASQIDIVCVVTFLLLFYCLLRIREKITFKNVLLFGICVGLFIGVKVINIVWMISALPIITYIFIHSARSNKLSLTKMSLYLSVIVFMVILFGCYMYIKNYYFLGNPLFPVGLKIFNFTIFKGLMSNSSYSMKAAPYDRFNFMRIAFHEGLGIQFLAFILPGTFLPLLFLKKIKHRIGAKLEYFILFSTPLIMITLYTFLINIFIMRYIFPYLSMGLLIAVIFIYNFKWADKYIKVFSLISIITAAFQLAKGNELIISILLSIFIFTVLAIFVKQILHIYNRSTLYKFVCVLMVLAFLTLVYLNNKYDKEEFNRYPSSFSKKEAWQADIGRGWKALNEITGKGARVAYTGRLEFYPLYGERFKNFVKYVSVNKKEITPYNKPDGLYRKIKDFSAWKENLKKDRIEYLFIALAFDLNRESEDPNKFPIEDEWASIHPEDFQLVFKNSLSRIYKVTINLIQ